MSMTRLIDLVRGELFDAGSPRLRGLSHGHPHIRVDEIDSSNAGGDVVGDGQRGP